MDKSAKKSAVDALVALSDDDAMSAIEEYENSSLRFQSYIQFRGISTSKSYIAKDTPIKKPDVSDNLLNDFELLELVASRLTASASFQADLARTIAMTGCKLSFEDAATPPSTAPAIDVPNTERKLWVDRDPGVDPIEFIRKVYGPQIAAGGFSRADMRTCDPALYNAHAQWVRRHPDAEDIPFAPTVNRNRIRDAEEAIKRRRESSKLSAARTRSLAKELAGPT